MNRSTVCLSGDVARTLGISRERVRHLVLLGQLRVLAVTVGGVHLFAGADVERLRKEREARALSRTLGRHADRAAAPRKALT